MSIDQSFVRVGQSTTIYAAIGVRQKMVDAKTQDLVRATLWGKAKREARVRPKHHPPTIYGRNNFGSRPVCT